MDATVESAETMMSPASLVNYEPTTVPRHSARARQAPGYTVNMRKAAIELVDLLVANFGSEAHAVSNREDRWLSPSKEPHKQHGTYSCQTDSKMKTTGMGAQI